MCGSPRLRNSSTSAECTSEDTKYSHVVAALPPAIAMEVREILMKKPVQPYSMLKAILLQRTCPTEKERLHQLLATSHIGDRAPSQLLRDMKRLRGDCGQQEDIIFRHLFLTRLPESCQQILALLPDDTPLDQIALHADRIMVTTPRSIAPLMDANPLHPLLSDAKPLLSSIEELSNRVDALTSSKTGSKRGSYSPDRSRQGHGICYYHTRFGKKARRCRSPCRFKGNGRPSSQ
jgi:hypothetical protein